MQTLLHRVYARSVVSPQPTHKMQLRTVVRLPKVDERPVEPHLALLMLRLCRRARLEMRRRTRGREHERVRADRLEAIIFPEADDAPYQHVHAQAREDRVDSRPIRESTSVSAMQIPVRPSCAPRYLPRLPVELVADSEQEDGERRHEGVRLRHLVDRLYQLHGSSIYVALRTEIRHTTHDPQRTRLQELSHRLRVLPEPLGQERQIAHQEPIPFSRLAVRRVRTAPCKESERQMFTQNLQQRLGLVRLGFFLRGRRRRRAIRRDIEASAALGLRTGRDNRPRQGLRVCRRTEEVGE